MDGTLMLQAEQLMCGPLSKLWDICLGCASSLPCTHFLCIEGIIPVDLIIGLLLGLGMGVCSAATFVTCFSCPCCLGCGPCAFPILGGLAPSLGYYVWPCPPGLVWTCLCCFGIGLPLEYCIGCCPGMTYECIGPILGRFEVCLWPYITRFTSCLNRFTCPCL
jgi:hypothetical protein